VQMGAYDVAIAEAAIGAGITGALLLAAWDHIRPAVEDAGSKSTSVDVNHQGSKEHV
jgi:hypothetical protein